MPNEEYFKRLDEAIKRYGKKPWREQMEDLMRQGIINEKFEVIVRMPIGPGPNAKKKKRKRKKQADESE